MDLECGKEQSGNGYMMLFPNAEANSNNENEESYQVVEQSTVNSNEMTIDQQSNQHLTQEEPQEQIVPVNGDAGDRSCSTTPPQLDQGEDDLDNDDSFQNEGLKRRGINFNDRERFYFYSAIIEARGRLGIEYSKSKPYSYVSKPLWAEAKRILANNYEIHKIPPENYPRNIKSLRELAEGSMRNGTTTHQKRSGRPKIIDNFEEQTKRYLENNLSLRQIQAAFRQDHNQTIAVSTLSRIAHKLKMVRPKCYHRTNRPKTPKRKPKSSTVTDTSNTTT